MKTVLKSLLSAAALALLLGTVPALIPVHAHAEGAEADVRPKAKQHRKVKRKKAPAPAKPAAPIPYSALAPQVPAQHVNPGPPTVATTPDALPQPSETNKPIPPDSDVSVAPRAALPAPPPPPPPPPAAVPNVAPTVSAPAEISLRCETQVLVGKRVISHGVFFIDLFPSAVFPDQHADFKFLFVEPSHNSLIRDSICLDAMCPANVTGSAYYLVNQVTKKGDALRITLDRSQGAFYAEEIDRGFLGFRGNAEHRGERGYCTPQPLPGRMF